MVERNLERAWFITQKLGTVKFHEHFSAYEMVDTTELQIIKQQELLYPLPLHLINISVHGQNKIFVCPKYQIPVI